jgi:intracellular multiplication protein IcmL
MAIQELPEQYIPKNNDFYRNHYHHVILGLMVAIVFVAIAIGVVLFQMTHRPQPIFYAQQPTGERMQLQPYSEPNLLPDTILQFASKGAMLAYTFDFVSYKQQIALARPYFTTDGWNDYLLSVDRLIQTYGVVAGTPVISNQGPLPGKGYVWRVQIPFLVAYQSADNVTKRNFIVVLTIVQVPTNVNPQGIGIDQFVMY